MNTQRMAEELAEQLIFGAIEKQRFTRILTTALQAAADTAREWQPIENVKRGVPVVCFRRGYEPPAPFAGIVDYDNSVLDTVNGRILGNVTHVFVIPPHTPRTAQQSEAVIAKALGKNLTVVKEGSDRE